MSSTDPLPTKKSGQEEGSVPSSSTTNVTESGLLRGDCGLGPDSNPFETMEASEDEAQSIFMPQLDSLVSKLSVDSSVNYGLSSFKPLAAASIEGRFVDPALENLAFLGIDFEELSARAHVGDFEWKYLTGFGASANPFLKEEYDFSLRGNSDSANGGALPVAFPKDQYAYSNIPPQHADLHEWFAVPVGNATLLYDSEILSFRDSGVAVSLAIGVQNIFPLAGMLTAGTAAVSLWQDLKVFSGARTGIERSKYALGALADTAIIASGIGAALKNVSPETRMGLASCGYVGRLMVELIPNMVQFDNRKQDGSSN